MTPEELQEAIAELKAQGASEEDIAASFYLMFSEGKVNLDQFVALLDAIDYELDEEFLNMDEQTQRTFALNNESEPEGEEDKPASSDEDEGPKEEDEEKAMRLFGK